MSLQNENVSEPEEECPDPRQWLAVLTGTANGQQVSALEDHLSRCDACETTLDAILEESDTCVRMLAAQPSVSEDEPEYQRLYSQLVAAPQAFHGSDSMQQLVDSLPAISRSSDFSTEVPRQLGQYELLDPIGHGATGSVFRARHLKLDRVVALKVLARRRSADPGSVARFLQEMKAVGRLDHPNIIRATDAGEFEGWHYLVMEYVGGTSVSSILRRVPSLSIADACEIARQAALGLACAHRQGMVHRDVKPSNLLFTYSGQVKLLDLGLVAIQDESAFPEGATASDASSPPAGPSDNVTRGTSDYMSPEQWTRYHDVDSRSDLYSLGCTLFKLLSGVAPYKDLPGGCANTMQAHLSGEVPDVGRFRADLPAGLASLVTRLMAKDPTGRIQTADEVADKLFRYARGCDLAAVARSVAAESPGMGGRLSVIGQPSAERSHRVTRRRVLIASGSAVVAAVGTIAFGRKSRWWNRRPKLITEKWRTLVPMQPNPVIDWSHDGTATWQPGDEPGVWLLQSRDSALLQLGQPVKGVFSLATEFRQENWQGGAGLFFRFRKTDDPKKVEWSFQSIQWMPQDEQSSGIASAGAGSDRGFILLWTAHRAVLDDQGWHLTHKPWADTRVDRLTGDATASLEIVLGRRNFPEVRWNGRWLPESEWSLSFEGRQQTNLAAARLRTEYMGHLGLVASGGVTQFLHPRLMYHE